MDSDVVLPAPFGPSRPKNEPVGTSRSTPSTATTRSNRLTRSRIASATPSPLTTPDGTGITPTGSTPTASGLPTQRPSASGAWRRSIVVLTSAGTRRRVAREPTTITAKASGTVHAAGTLTRIAAHPDSGGPTIVTTTAPPAAPPPPLKPAIPPAAGRAPHHKPSTSNGAETECATADG